MPIGVDELLKAYGAAVEARNASLFVGAGLSRASGYPDWSELLGFARVEAHIPDSLSDFPLVAEYYIQQSGGRDRLERWIATALRDASGGPNEGHQFMAKLPISEIWTTNYDNLIEASDPTASVIASDEAIANRSSPWGRRIIKMHGSLSPDEHSWITPPVISRTDFERYEFRFPRIWSLLRATFLTKSFLFLGFSFSDPNIELLLRLARSQDRSSITPEHFTVLTKPSDPDDRILHDLRVRDLESTGIAVVEVDHFDDIAPVIQRLVRRTCEPRLFVSGSDQGSDIFAECCSAIGSRFAESSIDVASLGGPAGMGVSNALGLALSGLGTYRPERIQLFFRKKNEPPAALPERLGTAIYSGLDKDPLRRSVIDQCRALLVLGGSSTTREEVEIARSLGIPVIPVGATGGVARAVWEEQAGHLASVDFGGKAADESQHKRLVSTDPNMVAMGAYRLVSQAMYLGQ